VSTKTPARIGSGFCPSAMRRWDAKPSCLGATSTTDLADGAVELEG